MRSSKANQNALLDACRNGDATRVASLLPKTLSKSQRRMALISAVAHNHTNVVDLLAPQADNFHALVVAAYNKNSAMVQHLLGYMGDGHLPTKTTALWAALHHRDVGCAAVLLPVCPPDVARQRHVWTSACRAGHLPLVRAGLSTRRSHAVVRQALCDAIHFGQVDVVRILMEHYPLGSGARKWAFGRAACGTEGVRSLPLLLPLMSNADKQWALTQALIAHSWTAAEMLFHAHTCTSVPAEHVAAAVRDPKALTLAQLLVPLTDPYARQVLMASVWQDDTAMFSLVAQHIAPDNEYVVEAAVNAARHNRGAYVRVLAQHFDLDAVLKTLLAQHAEDDDCASIDFWAARLTLAQWGMVAGLLASVETPNMDVDAWLQIADGFLAAQTPSFGWAHLAQHLKAASSAHQLQQHALAHPHSHAVYTRKM